MRSLPNKYAERDSPHAGRYPSLIPHLGNGKPSRIDPLFEVLVSIHLNVPYLVIRVTSIPRFQDIERTLEAPLADQHDLRLVVVLSDEASVRVRRICRLGLCVVLHEFMEEEADRLA